MNYEPYFKLPMAVTPTALTVLPQRAKERVDKDDAKCVNCSALMAPPVRTWLRREGLEPRLR